MPVGLLDPDPDLLVRDTDPDPDPSITKQKKVEIEKIEKPSLLLLYDFFSIFYL
jgi:hypothetical protein